MKKSALILSGILLSGAAMATEKPSYTVLQKEGDFELRRYDAQIVAQTWVSGDQRAASNQGFKVLADYIFGNNTAPNGESSEIAMTAPVKMQPSGESSKKIAMTAPVLMQQGDAGKWRVQFIMPSKYTMETLPKPNNPEITIKQVPVKTYGVIGFSGLTGSKKVAKKTKELQDWMNTQNLTITGNPELARYNPPWTPPFMRHNEVMMEYQAK